jgi:glycosyltransferase involved in cell wall biosynthesis
MTAPPSRLSIVHLLAPAPYGGLESVVLTLAAAQRAAGDAVCVAVVMNGAAQGHPFVRALAGRGIDVEVISVSGRDYIGERKKVRALLEQRRADVLHTHGYRPDVVDAPVARWMGVPTITTVHGFTGGGGVKGRLYEWLQLRSFRAFDAVVAVSEKLRGDLVRAGVRASRVHTVRNSHEADTELLDRAAARRTLGIGEHERVAVWVGRMSAEKAPDVMVRVLAAAATPDLRLSFVGAGALERDCRELADSLGVTGRIRWHGVVDHAGRLLRAFDAVVLTSWTEGTPVVLLEAMGAGVPIVATSVGGIPESVGAESAALLPAGDVVALARAVDEIFSRPADAAMRSAAARERLARERAVGPWVERHREIYRSLLERR